MSETKRLHYYVDAERGLQVIRDRRVRVSRIMALNDPFESLPVNMKDPARRRLLKSVKQDLDGAKGVLCFTESRKNPVMWAHYADRYKGVCLAFDVAVTTAGNLSWKQINYVKRRLSWSDIQGPEAVEILLLTKFYHWSYEQEWRAIVDLAHCDQSDGHYYVPFSGTLVLKGIYVGMYSPIDAPMVAHALNGLRGVRVSKTRPAYQKFEIVINFLSGYGWLWGGHVATMDELLDKLQRMKEYSDHSILTEDMTLLFGMIFNDEIESVGGPTAVARQYTKHGFTGAVDPSSIQSGMRLAAVARAKPEVERKWRT